MGEFEDKLNGILNNPQEMEKIMALARNFMGGGSGSGPPPPPGTAPSGGAGGLNVGELLGGIDPGLLAKLGRGLAGGVGSAALLQSITPHLKDERRGQLKRAITIAQVIRVARTMFSE
ncbi:MAG: hypothetical protein FWE12_01125 [Oscillospiraceae bacterium]|nr:hypothetical protein [Oscillospiraceae bacterium]